MIPGAAGGVGSFLVQLAKRFGAGRVIGGAANSLEKRDLVARLGADVTLDSSHADWPERVREATDGRGADVVFVMSGGEIGARSLQALAPRGRLVLFGVDAMFETSFDKGQMAGALAQNQSIIGLATLTLAPAELRAAFDEILRLRHARGARRRHRAGVHPRRAPRGAPGDGRAKDDGKGRHSRA